MNKTIGFIKKNKGLFIYILIPLLISVFGYLLGGKPEVYSKINRPPFAPPGYIFPIVWPILYILMGISAYIISIANDVNDNEKQKALNIYYIQLLVNCLWSLFFFRLQWYLFSFLWILLLLGLVIYMCYLFYKIDKKAMYLNIPYILWLAFASTLAFGVYFLNK